MSDPALPTFRVRIEFRPYSHGEVKDLLHRMARDFGLPGRNRRWRFVPVSTPDSQDNAWIIDFLFQDANDAVMFSLRHQR